MSKKPGLDPEFKRSRKEALWILLAFAVCLVWTVTYSALMGYGTDSTEITLIFGIPSWVFWGVVAPWVVATAFSIWFSLAVIREEDDEQKSGRAGG